MGISDEVATIDGILGKQTNINKLTCIVCDYVLNDPNSGGIVRMQEKISKAIRNFLKNNR